MIVELIEEDGELVLPIPPEFMKELNWKEGDIMTWIDNEDGTFTLRKKDNTPEIESLV